MTRIFSIMITLSFVAIACATSDQAPNADVTAGADEEVIEGSGTVRYVDLEGGFYGIVAEDGTQYDPVNLDEAFMEDGLRVHFQARVREDMVGAHMWGTYVEILAIERSLGGRF